jgi:hypothetical protein
MRLIELTDLGTGEPMHINADHIVQVRPYGPPGQKGTIIFTLASSMSEGTWKSPTVKEPPERVVNLMKGSS